MSNQPIVSSSQDSPKITSGTRRIPVLPVRDTVLFPHAVLPLTVGRESSIQLIESLGEERAIVVAAQLDPRLDSPKPADLHTVGTLATVHKIVRMPNQSRFVFTEGVSRVRMIRYIQSEPFMIAEVETLDDVAPAASSGFEALERNVIEQFQQIVTESATLSDELRTIAANIEEPARLVDFVASSLPFLTTDDKQQLLETPGIIERLEQLNKLLAKEIEVQQLRAKIQTSVQDQVQQSQRDYYLREQLKAIQKELGEQDEGQREIDELRQKIEAAGMPEDVKKEAMKELNRLGRMSPMAADYSLTRNYIEWLAVLPWAKSSGTKIDIGKARDILDEDHYELKKVKDRILDYLSVLELKPDMKGPILCFVGPPGVGKTSLGRSIARVAWRHARRGRDSRTSPDLHWSFAGPDHPEHSPRGNQRPGDYARRDRQAGPRLSRRSLLGIAGDTGPRAEQHVPRQLSGRALRSFEGVVYLHGEHAGSGSGAPARQNGDHSAAGLQRGREAAYREPIPDSTPDHGEWNH
jgi:ATP-dependent Lon protease